MELILAKNEEIIKKYDYSEKHEKRGLISNDVTSSLIITNKRIINESVSKRNVFRKEIPIESADYVSTAYASNAMSFLAAAALAIIFVLFLIFYFSTENSLLLALSIIAAVAAVVFIIIAILKRGAGVKVEISGRMGEYGLMAVGASSLQSAKRLTKIKIKIDKGTAQNMINELGATILDLKKTK